MMEPNLIQRDLCELHKSLLVADGHCDTLLELAKGASLRESSSGHVDLIRLKAGGVGIQFFAAFIESVHKPQNALVRAIQLIDTFINEAELCRDFIVPGCGIKQIKRDIRDDRIVAVLGIEGGEALHGDLGVLRNLYRLGVRFLGLTWNQRNQIADGVWERSTGGGLTTFGCQVVAEMNRLGMMIDLAHISEPGFWDVISKSKQPVMVSHANCYRLCPHPRNLKDDQIKGLAKTGGILGLSFVPDFLGEGRADLDGLVDHIDHVAGLVGTDIIAMGSDFDGISETARGLEDCRCYPGITAKLWERGYTEKEIRNIMGENLLKFMERILH